MGVECTIVFHISGRRYLEDTGGYGGGREQEGYLGLPIFESMKTRPHLTNTQSLFGTVVLDSVMGPPCLLWYT